MQRPIQCRRRFLWRAATGAFVVLLCWCASAIGEGSAADQVELDTSATGPRVVEPLTAKSVARDYLQAWSRLAEAMDHGDAGRLEGPFVGTARAELGDAVEAQRKSGVHVRYSNPKHSLQAVFYAPEGDVLQLHDTVECDIQVADGSSVLHQEHATLHYVVLITPGADRWVVRQMQAVPGF